MVDGITAIAGLERYGTWYAEFRGLMHSLDTLAGLVVGHAALGSGHAFNDVEAMARPDGLWNLTSNDRDIRPGSARYFDTTR